MQNVSRYIVSWRHVAAADHRRAVDAGIPSAVLCQALLGLLAPAALLEALLAVPPRTEGRKAARRHSVEPSV